MKKKENIFCDVCGNPLSQDQEAILLGWPILRNVQDATWLEAVCPECFGDSSCNNGGSARI